MKGRNLRAIYEIEKNVKNGLDGQNSQPLSPAQRPSLAPASADLTYMTMTKRISRPYKEYCNTYTSFENDHLVIFRRSCHDVPDSFMATVLASVVC
jgi:hypothetical protein